MKTVVLGQRPPELEDHLARRRALGLDTYDEVWEGVLHMVPAPAGPHAEVQAQVLVALAPLAERRGWTLAGPTNVGGAEDFRVPDAAVFPAHPVGVYQVTALLVVEVLSPDDETFDKLAFYAAHEVNEVVVVDPAPRQVRILRRQGSGYEEVDRSELLGTTAALLADAIAWPPS